MICLERERCRQCQCRSPARFHHRFLDPCKGRSRCEELDVTGAPAAGDNNTVTLSLTGPQEYNNLQVTLTNGVGTLLTLVEGAATR